MSDEATDLGTVLSQEARDLAREVLQTADERDLKIATAESCTGGLLSTLLTDLPGVSHCFECGFVVYSDAAKKLLLGIPAEMLATYSAVSKEVAVEMAEQALRRCEADVALAITGYAGPGEPDDEEGLVHFAVSRIDHSTGHRVEHFGPLGRDGVRARALETGLRMLTEAVCPG